MTKYNEERTVMGINNEGGWETEKCYNVERGGKYDEHVGYQPVSYVEQKYVFLLRNM